MLIGKLNSIILVIDKMVTKRERIYTLFDDGKSPSSPELKALGIKAQTRANYYFDWKRERGIATISNPPPGTRAKGAISELQMVVPPKEAEGEDREAKVEEEEAEGEEGGTHEEPETKDEEKDSHSDGKKPLPTMVAGQGLTFAITISTKTLALYQYAASLSKSTLTIGDFLDTCVEDYYKGRGLDLGLVKLGGDGQNG